MLYTLRRNRHRHYAICECGWESQWVTSPGMAGAAWDLHLATCDRVMDIRVE